MVPMKRSLPANYIPFYRDKAILLSLLGGMVVVSCGMAVLGWWADKRLQERIRGYTRNGQPVSVSDLSQCFRAIPASGNAAVRYQALLERREHYLTGPLFVPQSRRLPLLDQQSSDRLEWGPELRSAVAVYVEANRWWYDELPAMAALSGCAPRAYESAIVYAQVRRPVCRVVAHGVHCLVLRAMMNGIADDANAALTDLEVARRLNRLVLAEPFVHNVVTALCGERSIARCVGELMDNGRLSADQVERARRLCLPLGVEPLRAAVSVERLAGLDFCQAEQADQADSFGLSYFRLLPRYIACQNVMEYLDFVDACRDVLLLPGEIRAIVATELGFTRMCCERTRHPLIAMGPPIGQLGRFYGTCLQESREMRQRLKQWRPEATVAAVATPPSRVSEQFHRDGVAE